MSNKMKEVIAELFELAITNPTEYKKKMDILKSTKEEITNLFGDDER